MFCFHLHHLCASPCGTLICRNKNLVTQTDDCLVPHKSRRLNLPDLMLQSSQFRSQLFRRTVRLMRKKLLHLSRTATYSPAKTRQRSIRKILQCTVKNRFRYSPPVIYRERRTVDSQLHLPGISMLRKNLSGYPYSHRPGK